MKKFTLQMSTINKNMQLFKIHFRYIYFESLKCFFIKYLLLETIILSKTFFLEFKLKLNLSFNQNKIKYTGN